MCNSISGLSWLPRLAVALLCSISLTTNSNGHNHEDENLFVMRGSFSVEQFGGTLQFWDNQYEDNFFIGGGYQRMLTHHDWLSFGVEVGLGARLGAVSSAEVWAGGVARLGTFALGPIAITPALTAGFSVVTDTIGSEAARANALGIQAPFLYYLGPELALANSDHPNVELLSRIHHRSGGFGTIAPLDGSNAVTFGLRYKY